MLRRLIVVVMFLSWASLACTLAGNAENTLRQPTSDPGLILTMAAQRTPTTAPTATASATSTTASSSGSVILPPPCYPRTDWPVYVVVRGDTLGQIARRVGSTVDVLAAANCLSNPNVLEIGWQVRVPRLPATATPTQTPGPQYRGAEGRVQVGSPYHTSFDGNRYTVPAGVVLPLYWESAPQDATRVEFYALIISPGSGRVLVGVDTTPRDGALAYYDLDDGIEYSAALTAAAFIGDVRIKDTALETGLLSRVPTPEPSPDSGYVAISPNVSFDHGTYQLQAGGVVTLRWPEARLDAVRVEFYLSSVPVPQGEVVSSVLGIDGNPRDGAAIPWTVPADVNGMIHALAVLPNGRTQRTIGTVGVLSAQSQPPDGPVVVQGGQMQDGWLHLVYGQMVTLTWPAAPLSQAVRVDFYLTPTGTGTSDARILIATDSTLSDGASAPWTPTLAGLSGHLSATAILTDGRQVETGQTVQVVVD